MGKRFPDGTTPATKALAYRIWWAAEREADPEPLNWNITISELAERLGEPVARVRRVAQISGWLSRFRTTITDPSNFNGITERVDEDLERLAVRA